MFTDLDDYKDSEVKANEAIYDYALGLQSAGEYDKAIEYFSTISNYSSASERIAECRYILGKQYMTAGDYASAYDHLHLIPRYNDAGDLAMESNYLCAMQDYQDSNYAAALVRFKMFPDYKDCFSYWQICQYRNATNLLDAGSYSDAYQQFLELGDYDKAAYWTAVSQYYLLVNGEGHFSLDEIRNSLITIEQNNSEFALQIIESKVFTAAKLKGSWSNEDGSSYLTLSVNDDGSASMTLCFADGETPGTETVIQNVKFDNNLIYHMNGDNQSTLIRVESFTDKTDAIPNSVTVYNYSTDTTYTLHRTGQ